MSATGDAELGELIYVDNAGLAITWPFLPTLFERCHLLTRDEQSGGSRFADPAAASRAVQLLQYLGDGATATAGSPLALNQILCGLAPEVQGEVSIQLTDDQVAVCDELLRSILANWPALSSSSVDGLREGFLQRDGALSRQADGWQLQVERKTIDILLDQIPWSMTVLYGSWMEHPLHVEW